MRTSPAPAALADLEAVRDLDRAYSPVFSGPERYARLIDEGGLVQVLRGDDGTPVAFAAWSRVLDEASLLNLVVHPGFRRQGLAAALMTCSMSHLARDGITAFHLEVRASNTAAIALYRAHGFTLSGRRNAYYAGLFEGEPREDALLMTLNTEPSEIRG